MSVVEDVYTYLEVQALAGGSTGWKLLRRRLTDDKDIPDKTVVVVEDGGPLPEIEEAEGIGDEAQRDLGVRIGVRGTAWDGDATSAKAQDILNALHGLRNVRLTGSGGTLYLRVRSLTPEPVFVGFDDRGRPQHTVAFRLLR